MNEEQCSCCTNHATISMVIPKIVSCDNIEGKTTIYVNEYFCDEHYKENLNTN